jgi:uncharacterized protein YdhG (YjbR/CyaY superfamily)
MPARPAGTRTVATYLAAATPAQRAALARVRRTIKAAAPRATEAIAYGLIGYKVAGRPLLYVGYAKGHCALYGASVAAARADAERAGFSVSKGTIRFTPEHPLPARLVTKIVQARLAELAARSPR